MSETQTYKQQLSCYNKPHGYFSEDSEDWHLAKSTNRQKEWKQCKDKYCPNRYTTPPEFPVWAVKTDSSQRIQTELAPGKQRAFPEPLQEVVAANPQPAASSSTTKEPTFPYTPYQTTSTGHSPPRQPSEEPTSSGDKAPEENPPKPEETPAKDKSREPSKEPTPPPSDIGDNTQENSDSDSEDEEMSVYKAFDKLPSLRADGK